MRARAIYARALYYYNILLLYLYGLYGIKEKHHIIILINQYVTLIPHEFHMKRQFQTYVELFFQIPVDTVSESAYIPYMPDVETGFALTELKGIL